MGLLGEEKEDKKKILTVKVSIEGVKKEKSDPPLSMPRAVPPREDRRRCQGRERNFGGKYGEGS